RGDGKYLRALVPVEGGWEDAWKVNMNQVGVDLLTGCRADRCFSWERPYSGTTSSLVCRSSLTGEEVARVAAPVDFAYQLVPTPDGSMVVIRKGADLYVWEVGGEVKKVKMGSRKHFFALVLHPDGRHLLAGNNDGTVWIIDTRSWQTVKQYVWDIKQVNVLAVSPDGTLAAAGGTKGRVVVWDLDL
ncbi:MAG: hypothetical protein K2V38_04935, partial [Gemmataceae bacterium]|nr:hypothetical protein [Gemmataceae bacterium]